MNRGIAKLQLYPFEKLSKLLSGVVPASDKSPIVLSLGEPGHVTPQFIIDALCRNTSGFAHYPIIAGSADLRKAICSWLSWRFQLPLNSLDPERHVLPVNGTREALFSFAQFLIDRTTDALVLMPNPFYQIYEGAALLAGAQPFYINIAPSNGFLPDFDSVPDDIWKKCKLLYICTPGNPTGAVIPPAGLTRLLTLSERYGFVIASDECYSEIYLDEKAPPTGLLQAAQSMGNDGFTNCMVFHSLSKRSSVPGMRSGFVAGDGSLIEKFRLYRTYHGCAMPPPVQAASTAAWSDEGHVRLNRTLYQEKFRLVLDVLKPVMNVHSPAGTFYLWLETPIRDTEFTAELYRRYNVTVLPGSFLSRMANGENPGANRVRIALVAPVNECLEAARRIADFVKGI